MSGSDDGTGIRIRYTDPAFSSGGALARVRAAVVRRVSGSDWRPRSLLLPVLAWVLWRHLNDPAWRGIEAGLNLVVHEAGHLVCLWPQTWFGWEMLMVAGGTLFEIGVPLAVVAYFWRQADVFGSTIALFWMGTALLGVAHYAADARAQLLPLVSVGGGPVGHDWYRMLGAWGLLEHDQRIGAGFRCAGILTMFAALGASGLVLRWMADAPAAEGQPPTNNGDRPRRDRSPPS